MAYTIARQGVEQLSAMLLQLLPQTTAQRDTFASVEVPGALEEPQRFSE